jgi:hypothetical protein
MPESSFAIRSRRGDELTRLADQHMQHDLQPEDRDVLKSAASRVSLRGIPRSGETHAGGVCRWPNWYDSPRSTKKILQLLTEKQKQFPILPRY